MDISKEIKVLSKLTISKDGVPKNELKYIESGSRISNFFERILYKWKNTITIERHDDNFYMYFTNYRRWGIAKFENEHKMSIPAAEGCLAIKFFSWFKTFFNRPEIDIKNIIFEHSANLLADYAAHLFNVIDCSGQRFGRGWEPVGKVLFWKQHSNRFTFEMLREMVKLEPCPVETPLTNLFTEILPYNIVVPRLKPTHKVSYFGAHVVTTISHNCDEKKFFFWPPITNFENQELLDLTNVSYLPQPITIFFTELSKELDGFMQISGDFQPIFSIDGTRHFKFSLTLSLVDWEWLISSTVLLETDNDSPLNLITSLETSLISQIFSDVINRLNVPESITHRLWKADTPTTHYIAKILVRLMVELRPFRKAYDHRPWDKVLWKKVVSAFWSQTAQFSPKHEFIISKKAQHSIAPRKRTVPRLSHSKNQSKLHLDKFSISLT